MANIVETASSEIGPGILLTDGRAFFVGTSGGTTALYASGNTPTQQGSWAAGPAIPDRVIGIWWRRIVQAQGSKDGPAALEPGGNVLFPVAPVDGTRNNYLAPCSFFEFDGANILRVNDPPNADCPTYVGRLLVLPSGDILWAREDDPGIYLFQSSDTPNDAWRPSVTSAPAMIVPGTTVAVSGLQFNGLSQAVGYGDDHTAATNYPIVRIRNRKTGRIRYCRTANHTVTIGGIVQPSMGVATGNANVTTQVAVPNDIDLGPADLFVVANGIPSAPTGVVLLPP